MPGDTVSSSPSSDPIDVEAAAKEDADTAAARKELRQTVISEAKPKPAPSGGTSTPEPDDDDDNKDGKGEDRHEALKEQVSSPKKKRARDEVEDEDDAAAEKADSQSDVSTESARDRAARTQPEKKRARDEGVADAAESASSAGESEAVKPATSAAKFEGSAFGQLGKSSVSGFGALGGKTSGSVFGGSSSTSVFASAAPAKPAAPAAAPTLSFGSTAGPSPFGALNKPTANGFGSAFGSSSLGSPWAAGGAKPLGSFATPGQAPAGGSKPAKPFGAPDSDGEEEDEDEGGESASADEGDKDVEKDEAAKKGESQVDDKKLRLQRVKINDGEKGEVTLVQVRAKMFFVDRTEKGESRWVERGSGMLKINVPEPCVQFDDAGAPIPGTFDASGLEEEDDDEDDADEEAGAGEGEARGNKVARLIMRQDHTHRVLLNTVILPAMSFQEKASLKAVGVLFTAFEGDDAKPVSVQMRMSAASAKSFLNEVGLIQRELQNN